MTTNIKAKVNVNASSAHLDTLFGVDSTTKSDGAVLLYNANTELWEATSLIENKNTQIDGGHY